MKEPTPFTIYLAGLILGGLFIAFSLGLFAKRVRTSEGLRPALRRYERLLFFACNCNIPPSFAKRTDEDA